MSAGEKMFVLVGKAASLVLQKSSDFRDFLAV